MNRQTHFNKRKNKECMKKENVYILHLNAEKQTVTGLVFPPDMKKLYQLMTYQCYFWFLLFILLEVFFKKYFIGIVFLLSILLTVTNIIFRLYAKKNSREFTNIRQKEFQALARSKKRMWNRCFYVSVMFALLCRFALGNRLITFTDTTFLGIYGIAWVYCLLSISFWVYYKRMSQDSKRLI